MLDSRFRCFLVTKTPQGDVQGAILDQNIDDLPTGEVLIRVTHSSLNYKDALAATGHPGVVRNLPHVPGIDAAGTVVASDSGSWQVGDAVLVTGYGLGSEVWGGWSEYIRVPADWLVRMPSGFTAVDAMTLGTAGFTASQCVLSLQQHAITPESGEIVVTGASGGVGSLAVSILAKLGYQVTAVTGKPTAHQSLRQWGATRILDRETMNDKSDKPLLPAKWSGAIDTVGGNTLSTLLRSTAHRGCVTACGLVGGANLAVTVYPFLLRGVTLDGIDSAACPMPSRLDIWEKLANLWKPDHLEHLRSIVQLEDVNNTIGKILAGQNSGRTVVEIGG